MALAVVKCLGSELHGDQSLYGQGKTIDTSSKITVDTQFIASGNTPSEIRRIYVQDGQVVQNSKVAVSRVDTFAPRTSVTNRRLRSATQTASVSTVAYHRWASQ